MEKKGIAGWERKEKQGILSAIRFLFEETNS